MASSSGSASNSRLPVKAANISTIPKLNPSQRCAFNHQCCKNGRMVGTAASCRLPGMLVSGMQRGPRRCSVGDVAVHPRRHNRLSEGAVVLVVKQVVDAKGQRPVFAHLVVAKPVDNDVV